MANPEEEYLRSIGSELIIPCRLEDRARYQLDLIDITSSITGREDVILWLNAFIHESVQMIINAMSLYELGYWDSAFYSLRQAIEIVTTAVYISDYDDPFQQARRLDEWEQQGWFPVQTKMHKDLKGRKLMYADLTNKMATFFDELKGASNRLNKYIHKQGFEMFYSRQHALSSAEKTKRGEDFTQYLEKSIGAIAVLRLAIDPLPVLLADEDIYNRTGDTITQPFSEEFIIKYIGTDHLNDYKKTDVYIQSYEHLIGRDVLHPAVLSVVKDHFIDRKQIDNIISQIANLEKHDRIAVALASLSEKYTRIYCIGGMHFYFTSTQSKRKNISLDSNDFKKASKDGLINWDYYGSFLSYAQVSHEDFWVEHDERMNKDEIDQLVALSEISNLRKEN